MSGCDIFREDPSSEDDLGKMFPEVFEVEWDFLFGLSCDFRYVDIGHRPVRSMNRSDFFLFLEKQDEKT